MVIDALRKVERNSSTSVLYERLIVVHVFSRLVNSYTHDIDDDDAVDNEITFRT